MDWTGFWVPCAGPVEGAEGSGTKFLPSLRQEVQILHREFPADTGRVIVGISANNRQGDPWAEFHYPENAQGSEVPTWAALVFSE